MRDTAAAPERDATAGPELELHLFVTGASPRSQKAITGLTAVCERLLPGRYALEVTDIYQQPERAREYQLLAAPTLIRVKPLPVRRIVGDLSNRPQLLDALGLGASPA